MDTAKPTKSNGIVQMKDNGYIYTMCVGDIFIVHNKDISPELNLQIEEYLIALNARMDILTIGALDLPRTKYVEVNSN